MSNEFFEPDYLTIPFQLIKDQRLEQVDRLLYGAIYFFEHMGQGRCFASNSLLAKILGTTPRVIQNSLTNLEVAGYIRREYKDAAKRNRTQINGLIAFKYVSPTGDRRKTSDPQVIGVSPTGDRASDPQVTRIRIKNKNKEVAATPAAFSLKDEIKKMEEDKRRDINIIALYLEEKKPDIRTKEQLQKTIKRHLRAAGDLSPFNDDQIVRAARKAKQDYPEWTIETLGKLVTK